MDTKGTANQVLSGQTADSVPAPSLEGTGVCLAQTVLIDSTWTGFV